MTETNGRSPRYAVISHGTLTQRRWVVRDTWTNTDVKYPGVTGDVRLLSERGARRLAGLLNDQANGTHGLHRALALIEDLEEMATAGGVEIDPIELERDADGAVTGLILTGATYARLGALLAGGSLPTGGPSLEVVAVTMTLDMFETMLTLVTRAVAEGDRR